MKKTAEILEKINDLPTLPSIVYEFSQLINNPMTSNHQIVNLLINDQSLTSKVLRLANSAFYAVPGGVGDLMRATSTLGYDSINQIVLGTSIIKALKTTNTDFKYNLNDFWKHSIGVAYCNSAIGEYLNFSNDSELFSCGLLHDIGKLAFLVIDPEGFSEVIAYAFEHKKSYSDAELELKAPDHGELGLQLAKKWSLPVMIQKNIKYHDKVLIDYRDFSLTPETMKAMDITNLSDSLVTQLKFGDSGSYSEHNIIDPIVFKRLRLGENSLGQIKNKFNKNIEKAEGFLKILSQD